MDRPEYIEPLLCLSTNVPYTVSDYITSLFCLSTVVLLCLSTSTTECVQYVYRYLQYVEPYLCLRNRKIYVYTVLCLST